MKDKIVTGLKEISDKKYRDFNAKLIPNINNVMGIRIPVLRKYAKELYNTKDFDINTFITLKDKPCMEFTMLQGFVIGLKKIFQRRIF